MNKPFVVPSRPGLRQRMIEDMTMRGFSTKTRRNHVRIVSRFAAFLSVYACRRLLVLLAIDKKRGGGLAPKGYDQHAAERQRRAQRHP